MKLVYLKKNTLLLLLIATVYNISAQQNNNSIFNKLNLKHPTLKPVEKALAKNKEAKALKKLLTIYRQKENLYLKVDKNDVDYIKNKYPKDVKNTIKVANQVLNNYFLFRYDWDMEKTNIPHQFKKEIDWTAIPNGDEEWCYMLNRHRFWVDLGKAYMLTGKEKYAKGFVDQVTHWIDNNPLKDELKSLSWRRIEAGIRCENWIKSFEYIKNSKYVTPEFLVKFLNSLHQHANYINSNFSNFSQTSNWGVIEFHGLFNASLFLNNFLKSSKWKQDAISKLKTCITLQIMEDGSQWEQSPMYHNEVFHCYLNVNHLAKQTKTKLPKIIEEKTKKMAFANIQWQKPNYHQPMLGDSDDTDLRGILTLAAFVFNDSTLKSRAFSEFDYENYFITGKESNVIYKKLKSKTPEFLSVYQQSSGDFYMRNSWAKNAVYSSINLKKLGCGHGHDNLLHFTLYANYKDYLIDGGRYSYVDNKWREFFKNNKSHNTLGVDNLTNSIYKDSWTNSFEAHSNGAYTKSTIMFNYAEAENTAYKRLEDPVSMKRRMLYLKPNVWLLFDSFSSNKTHKYSQYFNFPNDSITIKNKNLITTYKNNNLKIQPINDAKIKLSNSWWSPEYNLKKQNKRAEIYKKETGFSTFITLLYFPESSSLKYTKTPVYSRKNVLLTDKEVEAVTITIDKTQYTIVVVHNPSSPANHFYKVNNIFVSGEVVLIKKTKKATNLFLIKD